MVLSKPLPVLPEMPWNVKKLIAASADSFTKVSLRQCSKEFKSHVDNSIFTYKKLSLSLGINHVETIFELDSSHFLEQSFPEDPAPINRSLRRDIKPYVSDESIKEGVDYFMEVLKRKNVIVDQLKIQLSFAIHASRHKLFIKCLKDSLSSLDHNLRVKMLKVKFIDCISVIPFILPHLEPGTLKTLKFVEPKSISANVKLLPPQSIVQTDQWKQAEELILKGFSSDLPYEDIQHFKWFTAEIDHLTIARAKEIVEKALQNVNFETIHWKYTSLEPGIHSYRSKVSHNDIPGAGAYVTVSLDEETFMVERAE